MFFNDFTFRIIKTYAKLVFFWFIFCSNKLQDVDPADAPLSAHKGFGNIIKFLELNI